MNTQRPHIILGFDADQTPEAAALLSLMLYASGHRCYALFANPREIFLFHMDDDPDKLTSAAEWFHSRKWQVESDSKTPTKPA